MSTFTAIPLLFNQQRLENFSENTGSDVYINQLSISVWESFFLNHNQHHPSNKAKTRTINSSPSYSPKTPKTTQTIIMKFLAIIPFLSLTALAAAIAEPEAYADGVAADALLDKRANCNQILPLCGRGTFIKKNSCQCPGQKPTCDLWACPNGRRVSSSDLHSDCPASRTELAVLICPRTAL
jgi:hypothetical protein